MQCKQTLVSVILNANFQPHFQMALSAPAHLCSVCIIFKHEIKKSIFSSIHPVA